MRDDRWRRVKRLFEIAVDQPPAERSAFVLAAVAGDDSLRREVKALLEADEAVAALSNQLPVASASLLAELRRGLPAPGLDVTTFAADEHVGPYRIRALLGRGGMGEVFRAHDSKLNREVALKVLPPAYEFDPDRLARLRREAERYDIPWSIWEYSNPYGMSVIESKGPAVADRDLLGALGL